MSSVALGAAPDGRRSDCFATRPARTGPGRILSMSEMAEPPPNRTPRALSEQLASALTRAERGLTRRLAAVLALEGRTVEESRALTLLADGGGHPMAELAKYLLLPSPTVTRLVDRMVADNLAHRKVDERDRRRVLVYATARGHRLQRKLERLLHASQDEIVADPTGAERLLELLVALETRARHEPAQERQASSLP